MAERENSGAAARDEYVPYSIARAEVAKATGWDAEAAGDWLRELAWEKNCPVLPVRYRRPPSFVASGSIMGPVQFASAYRDSWNETRWPLIWVRAALSTNATTVVTAEPVSGVRDPENVDNLRRVQIGTRVPVPWAEAIGRVAAWLAHSGAKHTGQAEIERQLMEQADKLGKEMSAATARRLAGAIFRGWRAQWDD